MITKALLLNTVVLTTVGALFEHYVIDPHIKPRLPKVGAAKQETKTDPVVSAAERLGF